MKNSVLMFLLGVFVTISIAATTPSVELFIIKPAKPVSVITIVGRSKEAQNYINKYVKQGYIFKSFTPSAYYDDAGLLVMEKY